MIMVTAFTVENRGCDGMDPDRIIGKDDKIS